VGGALKTGIEMAGGLEVAARRVNITQQELRRKSWHTAKKW
jgi:hypothetical protein